MVNQNLGPLMVDMDGYELTSEDKEVLEHPAVCGVIIFAKNFDNIKQVQSLNNQIKNLKSKNKGKQNQLLIAVDQEGGPVQRIKQPLTVLPPMHELGKYYDYDHDCAIDLTTKVGWLLAQELMTVGFDFSFTPVVDLNLCDNKIIKQRSFHKKPNVVSELAAALCHGLKSAGMAAVAKHFPGHGGVLEDSHETTPSDIRSYDELEKNDLIAFEQMISHHIEAIMTSHIIFPNIDKNIVSFSKFWLQDILRDKLNYRGLIISDDLNMNGADFIINDHSAEKMLLTHSDRVKFAIHAGCELILLCNNRKAVEQTLDSWSTYNWQFSDTYSNKINRLRAKPSHDYTLDDLKQTSKWQEVINHMGKLELTCTD